MMSIMLLCTLTNHFHLTAQRLTLELHYKLNGYGVKEWLVFEVNFGLSKSSTPSTQDQMLCMPPEAHRVFKELHFSPMRMV